ncbi:MAG: hypothetical protein JWN37_415 [Candidatus Nomurabacteria bacterium]|nr:hypothetical protein [Candidatus Nomurabacteria bacterium]
MSAIKRPKSPVFPEGDVLHIDGRLLQTHNGHKATPPPKGGDDFPAVRVSPSGQSVYRFRPK